MHVALDWLQRQQRRRRMIATGCNFNEWYFLPVTMCRFFQFQFLNIQFGFCILYIHNSLSHTHSMRLLPITYLVSIFHHYSMYATFARRHKEKMKKDCVQTKMKWERRRMWKHVFNCYCSALLCSAPLRALAFDISLFKICSCQNANTKQNKTKHDNEM